MPKIRAASEMLRGAVSKECPSTTTHHLIITWEFAASDDGDSAAMIQRPACSSARSSFFINICNIRGVFSYFPFVEHHLSSFKPHLLFLTETQVLECADSKPYSVTSYCLNPQFSAKGCCAHMYPTMLFALVSLNWSLLNSLLYGLNSLLNLFVLFIYLLILLTIQNPSTI
ncbi:UNVERIFIED_CONTAM: hypothetical protein RMT77_004580 [Armadillidium vulgare]